MPTETLKKKSQRSPSSHNEDLVDRSTAAKTLNISLRTLDRYIKRDQLSGIRVQGHVFISKKEMTSFLNSTKIEEISEDDIDVMPDFSRVKPQEENSYKEEVIPNTPGKNENGEVKDVALLRKETVIYKKMYGKLLDDYQSKTKELEKAQYRLGELENQMKHSIPTVEALKKEQEIKGEMQSLQKKVTTYEKDISISSTELRKYRINQLAYITLLSILMLTFPIYVLLKINNLI